MSVVVILTMLTKREREIVQLVAEGLKDRDIAEKLFISRSRVKNILSRLYYRHACDNRTHLVMYCYEKGWMNAST